MASLTAQMEALQQQQAILTEKIKEEEEKKRQEGLTIEHLENLNSQQKKNMMRNFKTKKNVIRFLVTDFNLFTELDNCIQLFGPIKWLCIDVSFTHNEDYRNITLLNNLFKSSYIV